MRRILLFLPLLALTACSHDNNLLLGEVRAVVDGHEVVVTDCYRFSVPPPHRLADGAWEFMPCRDARVVIQGERVTVNGQAYGPLKPSDGVLVDHGVVSITH
jgi:hypothetical protein